MKLKKLYTHNNKKQIWRILPTSTNKIVIEERDSASKEVFFTCLNLQSGKKVFDGYQLDEKNWCGIESIYKDVIYFHVYGKPDMPTHKGIIAFDINKQTILWQSSQYVFSFIYDDKLYCSQQRFESKAFFALDYLSGKILEDVSTNQSEINLLKEKSDNMFWEENYFFPEYFNRTSPVIEKHQKYLQQILDDKVIKGEISFLMINDLLLFNYHEVSKTNKLNNQFNAVDLTGNKTLVNETLDKDLINLMPESFFVKDNFLFLIVDKTKLVVYQIKE